MNPLSGLADSMPQFQWTITSGQIAIACSFLVLAWRLALIHKAILVFVAEHDFVVDWLSDFLSMPRQELTQVAMVKSGQKAKAAKGGQ